MKNALALALCLAAAGCFSRGESDECQTDADCADGDECTRVGECVAAGSAIRVELSWTIAGAAPSAEACVAFDSLEVVFYEGELEASSYAPIPCDLARSTYDKMPARLDRVELIAYQAGGIADSQTASLEPTGTTTVTFDLQP